VPSTYTTVNFCLFGSVWGQKVPFGTGNLTAQWDFYLSSGYVYVYSSGNPATHYNAPIIPMALSDVPVININGKSWLTFQHFLVNWFDDYGVYVQGTSDHLVFANMEADSMIPQGAQPLGFYVNESSQPADIKFYNDEAHSNYDGFRIDGFTFDGVGTPITLVNDKAYGNRDGALVDNTGNVDSTCSSSGCTDGGASMGPGAANYSHCHFYASSLAVANSTDVEWPQFALGPTAGAGNIPQDTPPAVQVWQRYPAQVTLTVDDAGMTPGADTYYEGTVLPIADAAGVPVGAAITVGYPLAQTLISEFQGWLNAGRDVTSHSISHTYYTNTDALDIQYTGSGTAATLSISGQALTITVTGAADGVSYNLARGQVGAIQTIQALREALVATGKFTATEATPCQGPYGTGCSAYTEAALLAQDLADVSTVDVRSGVYSMQLDVTRLTTDEITLSRNWMTQYLTGLPTPPVYVYPGGYETTTMQGITAGVPYTGARGALKEDLGVKDTYGTGFDVQNVTSFGVNPTWQGLAPAVLNQKIQALVWKQQVWGVPWGIFWHWNASTETGELSATEITNLIADFKAGGATILSNTALVYWLLGGVQETGTDGNTYYKSQIANMTLDFAPTLNSPVVDAGENLGTAYALDINGVNQNSYGTGWEIGAHVFAGFSLYGGGSGSHFTVGTSAFNGGGPPNYAYTSRSTAALGTITSPFSTSTLYNSTAYGPLNPTSNCITRLTDQNVVQYGTNGSGTVTANGTTTVTYASGTNFASNWNHSVIVINGTTYSITTPVNTTTLTTTVTVPAGTWNFTFAGINIDDDIAQGDFSFSGGSGDVMVNSNSTLMGVKGNGTTWIFALTKNGAGCFQNSSNGGENPNLSFGGPFGWSRVTPGILYHNAAQHLLTPEIITGTTTPMGDTTCTGAGTPVAACPFAPFDFATCPGVAALVAPGTTGGAGAVLGVGLNDAVFSQDIAWPVNGFADTQGYGHWAMVYSPASGCATLDVAPTALLSGTASIASNTATVTTTAYANMAVGQTGAITGASNTNFNCATATFTASSTTSVSYTCAGGLTTTGSTTLTAGVMIGNFGNVYGYCASSCATATPAGIETACYDANYTTGSGIHDSNILLNGNVLFASGACFSLGTQNEAYWLIGTTTIYASAIGTSSWNPGTAYAFNGHENGGVNSHWNTNDPTPNARLMYPLNSTNLSNYVNLTGIPSGASAGGGAHGAVAHPFADDSLPWVIGTGNNVGYSTPGQMTQTYLENEIWGEPSAAPGTPLRFVPTYNSTNSGGFGCPFTISVVSQLGDFVAWEADGFESLGLDSRGNQLCSVLLGATQ
jgi:hypothetical protein